MAVTLAYLNEILQKDYLPGFIAQLNEEASYFYKLMEKNTSPAMGSEETFLVTFGRSGGIGNRTEGGDVPQPNSAGRKQISVSPKNFYARIALSDRIIKSSKTGASFISALDQEMNEILRDSKDSLNRQMFGDGRGVLATVKTAGTTTSSITVNDPKFLATNQVVDIIATATGNAVVKSNAMITSVDEDTGVITLDSTTTVAVGDMIVTAGAWNLEVTGLEKIMSKDNTLYGIDRNVNKWFNPAIIDLSSKTINDNYMEEAIQKVDLKSGSKPDIILSGYQAYRALKNYLSTFQRYMEIETRYDAGHKTLSYDGIPVERDKYQNDTTMDLLKMDSFTLLSIGELFSYMNLDGNIMKAVSGKAQYEAILTSYAEIMCKSPRSNLRIKNIVVS